MSDNLDFLAALWAAYRDEAALHGYTPAPGDEAAWGGLMICAPTEDAAQRLPTDMKWLWETWAMPFAQPYPELLFGTPDTLSRRIEAAARTVPINEMFLIIPQGLHEPDDIKRSLELFATGVMPNFS